MHNVLHLIFNNNFLFDGKSIKQEKDMIKKKKGRGQEGRSSNPLNSRNPGQGLPHRKEAGNSLSLSEVQGFSFGWGALVSLPMV